MFYAFCVFGFWFLGLGYSIFNYFKHYKLVFGAGFTIFRVFAFSCFYGSLRHLNIFIALGINTRMVVARIFYICQAFCSVFLFCCFTLLSVLCFRFWVVLGL